MTDADEIYLYALDIPSLPEPSEAEYRESHRRRIALSNAFRRQYREWLAKNPERANKRKRK